MTGYEFETACRHHTHCEYLDENTAICRILTQFDIYVDTRDTGITPHLIQDGFWETWLTQCLAKNIKEGDICIDIGANFGYYSILMAALAGEQGRTIAVEPNPHVCKLLRSTASIHPFEVVEIALTDKNGKAVLHIPNDSFGDASIMRRKDRPSHNKSKVKVKTQQLDTMVKELKLPRVDVIKIDVEGLEPLVFKGMPQTIANNPGLQIVMEYSPYMYTDARDFTEYLFSNFMVNRIKDVESMQTLTADSISELLELKDHTDLYLVQNKGTST